MTLEEFHANRIPFYIDSETGIVKTPGSKFLNDSHAAWFSKEGIPYLHTVRGYIYDSFIMIYVNNFEIPNVSILIIDYLFAYFPKIEWIGLGCDRGKVGEIWKPKYKIYRDYEVHNG